METWNSWHGPFQGKAIYRRNFRGNFLPFHKYLKIQLKVLWQVTYWHIVTYCFHGGYEYNTIAGFLISNISISWPHWGVWGRATHTSALTSAARASEICFLDYNYLERHSSRYEFQFGRNTKTSKQGKPRNPIKFQQFGENRLCACSHVEI